MLIVSWLSAQLVFGQGQDTLNLSEPIAVTARPSNDSITLRWAPLTLAVWQLGNKTGYTIDRYVIARNGIVLAAPERTIITASAIKPLPENLWAQLVVSNRYAAIAAQALYGESFDIDLSKSDIFTIVNKVQENEQRFIFALLSADMSPVVAKALGLWFTDRNVKKEEKYVYRIIINTQGNASQKNEFMGSIFASPDDVHDLSKPTNLKAEFKDQLVSLRWDKSMMVHYTAYIVERSDDGKSFTPISDEPLVTVSPTAQQDSRYAYATDSLRDITKTYYYRVKGINPFGEESKPSDVVNGKADWRVTDVPYIIEGENIENKSIRIKWEFPEKDNSAIKGFRMERASTPQGNFENLTFQKAVSPASRTFEDIQPNQVNYYRITALGVNGEKYQSPVYLAQLVDSIPPLSPEGIKATINEYGKVELSWAANKERDIYGYRIYKSNVEKEEMSQITSEPISQTSYVDNVNLNTLNEAVYYSVMAIDRNQNHSELSSLLKVSLPDKVKPVPPVFLPVKSSEKGVMLSWTKSSSIDVLQYEIYRNASHRGEWQRIKIIPAKEDSVYQYTDETSETGITNSYTVVAIDEAGLESDPALAVNGKKISNGLRAPIQWKDPVTRRDQNSVVLNWNYDQSGIKNFRIYKAEGENSLIMYKTVTGDKRDLTDVLVPGKQYKYKILAIFDNDSKSLLSEELLVKF